MTKGKSSLSNAVAVAAAAVLALTIAGCGSSNSSNIVDVRTVDDVSNGGSATVEVNNGSVSGSQTYFTITPYHYLQPASCAITLQLSVIALTYPTTYANLSGGNYYTVYAIGNATITDPTATGYPSTILLQDDTSGASGGSVKLRFIQAAPDAGSASLSIDGAAVGSTMAYGAQTPYATYSGSSVSIAVTGTNGSASSPSTLVSKTLNLSAGHSYTLLMDEPTMGSGSYAIEVVEDH